MKVTRFNYPLENSLLTKIDLMIERCTTIKAKRDVVLLIEGGEGEGKTTLSIGIAYYISEKTKRPFSVKHLFFDVEKMIKFAQDTKEQIIIWDEPALQALSTDWASRAVKNITRLLMMARKKRHFIIINMTKFYKFNEYIVVDRAIGMIHLYSRRNIDPGRFIYINKNNLEKLWRDYRFKKKKNYIKYAVPFIRGTFPDLLNPNYKSNVLSEFQINKYEDMKDDAIKSIGMDKERPSLQVVERKAFLDIIRRDKANGIKRTQIEYAKLFDKSERTIRDYYKIIKELDLSNRQNILK